MKPTTDPFEERYRELLGLDPEPLTEEHTEPGARYRNDMRLRHLAHGQECRCGECRPRLGSGDN